MIRENSFSLQKIPLRRNLPRSNSNDVRVSFPRGGDSNIFWGVGKKYFGGSEDQPMAHINNPQPSMRKYLSVRNIMNVADIEGASPSVAPEKVKNIMRAKEQQFKGNSSDLLGQYEKLFALKQISPQKQSSAMVSSAIMSTSEVSSPKIRYNPTYVTTFALHH